MHASAAMIPQNRPLDSLKTQYFHATDPLHINTTILHSQDTSIPRLASRQTKKVPGKQALPHRAAVFCDLIGNTSG